MNIIDIILILTVSLAVYSGWKKGFIESSVELAIWLGSFLVAFFLSRLVVQLLELVQLGGFWVRPVSFIILLITCSRLISQACDRILAGIPDDTHELTINKAGGILPGLTSGIIYASLISFFVISYPLGILSQRTKDSKAGNWLTNETQWPGKLILDIASDVGYRSPANITVHTQGSEIVSLPFKTEDFNPRADLEMRMLQLINQERKRAGLNAMSFDKKLAKVAAKHSADMLKRGYFSHYTPEGRGPFDRMRSDRVRFIVAGENLALAQTLQSAHEGLMESPVHKANILHKSFRRVGIAILDAGVHGLMVTQNFRN